jgi:hypothetical protein
MSKYPACTNMCKKGCWNLHMYLDRVVCSYGHPCVYVHSCPKTLHVPMRVKTGFWNFYMYLDRVVCSYGYPCVYAHEHTYAIYVLGVYIMYSCISKRLWLAASRYICAACMYVCVCVCVRACVLRKTKYLTKQSNDVRACNNTFTNAQIFSTLMARPHVRTHAME